MLDALGVCQVGIDELAVINIATIDHENLVIAYDNSGISLPNIEKCPPQRIGHSYQRQGGQYIGADAALVHELAGSRVLKADTC